MAAVWVMLLLVLTFSLVVVEAQGSRKYNFQPRTALSQSLPDDDLWDESSDEEGDAEIESDDSSYDLVPSEALDKRSRRGNGEGNSGSSQSFKGIDVLCSSAGFHISMQTCPLSQVRVHGTGPPLSVINAAHCGYQVNLNSKTFIVPFDGCHVQHNGDYRLTLTFVDEFGETKFATAVCEFRLGLSSQSSGPPSLVSPCNDPSLALFSAQSTSPNCAVNVAERLPCGYPGISPSECERKGCCVSCSNQCFYPLEVCTLDQHFVFAIRFDSAPVRVDPTKLLIPGTHCGPIIVNERVAIFKFKITECGSHIFVVGDTKIYLAEVETVVKALSLKFGIITRNEPVRFLIECRYDKMGLVDTSLATIGYLVKTPTSQLPSTLQSSGLSGVRLRIAKDHTFSDFHPFHHQPLGVILGQTVFLELDLEAPQEGLTIIVNYCIAYPRSATDALVLIYEGCANPHDATVNILKVTGPNTESRKRFSVDAFQFLDQSTHKYLDEEIYFMCSTELCMKTRQPCQEYCFGQES